MQGQTPVRTFFFWYVIENVRSIKVIKSEGKNLGLQQHYSAAAASLSKWRFLLNAWTGQKRNFGSFYRNSSRLLHCMWGGHDFGNLLMDFPSPKNPLEKKETGPDHKTCKILSGKKISLLSHPSKKIFWIQHFFDFLEFLCLETIDLIFSNSEKLLQKSKGTWLDFSRFLNFGSSKCSFWVEKRCDFGRFW